MAGAVDLDRRLANFRSALACGPARRPETATHLAARLAEAVGGQVVPSAAGIVVHVDRPARRIPVDRERLARLPGQPPPDVPLVCLDTETTGLATAAGTAVFLVGLGWWEGPWFHQVQLLLPDHGEEAALLADLSARIPAAAWLVTYNGRGFDWPLLVTRYRMVRRDPPAHDGHLDLLPLVRRVFRHRMPNARLRTVETELLGVHRHEDVDGWEIPGRYLDFVRGGPAEPLADVVRHNDEDVRSLARLLGLVEGRFGDAAGIRRADRGDAAGLGRAYARERRYDEALACLDAALASAAPGRSASPPPPTPTSVPSRPRSIDDELEWWRPGLPVDFGGRVHSERAPWAAGLAAPWTEERLLVERAHLLRRLGRAGEAAESWAALAAGTTRLAAVAAIELAKLQEHRLGNPAAALAAVERARAILERRRHLGRPEPRLEHDLLRRTGRIRRRLATARLSCGERVRLPA